MKDAKLLTEGDINQSASRSEWYKTIGSTEAINWLERDADSFLHQALSTPCLQLIESCEGIYIIDANGKKYMDFHGNNVHQIGYRNPEVIEKVKQQLDILPFSPRRYTNKPAIELAEKLSSLLPNGFNRVLFAPGGTSVIGIALKLARVVTGKHKIISLRDSFHGASMDAIAAGGEEQFKQGLGPLMPGVTYIDPPLSYRNKYASTGNDIEYANQLETEIKNNEGEIGAFIIETIRNTDVQIPSKAYWKRIREICNEYQVLLILDEIPIAFGRTGKMFAFEHYGIEPDIICLGKGLGAGIIPIAAMVARDAYNIATDISLGHYTHEKSPLGAVAALGMLSFIESTDLLRKVQEDEIFVREQLYFLQQKHEIIADIRGIGLMWGIELVKNKDTKEKAIEEAEKVMYYCLKNGLSFKVSQGNVLQLCPPLVITRDQLMDAFRIIDEAIAALN
ncbi:MAG: aspartate aminotransferase family protein [Chitinophagaceae bacterium]|nr:aspartate aminotransferase family protein [Chitinophagaceae bacterium]